MKSNTQSGLSTLHVIITLTAVAVVFGLIATLGSTGDAELVTQNSADITESASPLGNLAQNIANDQTESVTQAANERNTMIEAQMDESELQANAEQNIPAEPSNLAPTPTTAGTFEAYSPEKLALAEDGTVVLFFHADWCPSCRGLENDLNAKLSQIPANTHILKLDYDTETELKKQYGVIRQHTLVVVDADGTELKKLTGLTNTLDQVVNQL